MTDNKPCGVAAMTDPPLYCGYADGHDGPHTWESDWVMRDVTEYAYAERVPPCNCWKKHTLWFADPSDPDIGERHD